MNCRDLTRSSLTFLASFLLVITVAAKTNQIITANVVGVHDGDTITVLAPGNTQVKVRLSGIDAPESHQAFGKVSKQTLSEKIVGQNVRLAVVDTDRYGRTIADVYVDERWINCEMVAAGMAWHYVEYSKDTRLAATEKQARDNRLGLWKDPAPIPPWQYRKESRSK